jgi:hypothetical protein
MHSTTDSNEAVLHYEILQEKAQSLGRAARQVQETLETLKRHDSNLDGTRSRRRDDLIADAAEKAHHFLILRELCGFRDWPEVAQFYNIPAEVLKRMGTAKVTPQSPS